MAGSVNRVTLLGNLCAAPEVRTFTNGGKVCNLRIATNETWKGKDGQKQERVEYHTVAIFSEGLAGVAERYLKKGSKVYIEGTLRTRKWQAQDGSDRYATEIVLQGPSSVLTMLDGAPQGQSGNRTPDGSQGAPAQSGGGWDDDDDPIPFIRGDGVW